MPKNRAEVFRKPIFGLLLELFLVIGDVVSDERLQIDHPCCLFEIKIRFFTEN